MFWPKVSGHHRNSVHEWAYEGLHILHFNVRTKMLEPDFVSFLVHPADSQIYLLSLSIEVKAAFKSAVYDQFTVR
jgi:hypothetical protein